MTKALPRKSAPSKKNLPVASSLPLKISPGDDIEAYLVAIHKIPLLSPEREQELAIAYHDHEDLNAARELVLSHLRFVAHIARSYTGYGLPQADLIQEGNVGLMKALKRFDPEQKVRFITFAVHWIKSEIHEYIIRNWRIVKIATTKAQRKLFFNLRKKRRQLGNISSEEAEEIADSLGVTVKDVREMEGRFNAGAAISFDAPSSNDDDQTEDVRLTPAQYLQSPDQDPAKSLAEEDWRQHSASALQNALNTLDERSRDVIEKRWLNSDHRATLHELSQKYEVSMERIRQIEQKAFARMRKEMGEQLN